MSDTASVVRRIARTHKIGGKVRFLPAAGSQSRPMPPNLEIDMENTNNNAMKGNGFKVKIITAGKKLALLNPNAPELKSAREWFKGGCISKYSNQDCDILQSLISASTNLGFLLAKEALKEQTNDRT